MSEKFERRRKKPEWPAFVDLEKWKHAKPQIFIIKERCKECEWCITFCPEQILEKSHEINRKGYHPPKLKEGSTFDDCAECHFCELICPEFAIFVKVPEKEEKE
ncbi:MAG: 4Fe-4S dicluster domain-containing protein [Candidatus Heimdallarchaeaceae archaeon]